MSKLKFSQLGAEKPSVGGGRSSFRLELLCDLARLRAAREASCAGFWGVLAGLAAPLRPLPPRLATSTGSS